MLADPIAPTYSPSPKRLRSQLDTGIKFHHPLVIRILGLRVRAKQLVNGPYAYRSADFATWYQETAELYADVCETDLTALVKERFYQRSFGRAKGVFTESQIFSAFKADMNQTIEDLQRIIVALERQQRELIQRNVTEPTLNSNPFRSWISQWRYWLGVSVLFILMVTAFFAAVMVK